MPHLPLLLQQENWSSFRGPPLRVRLDLDLHSNAVEVGHQRRQLHVPTRFQLRYARLGERPNFLLPYSQSLSNICEPQLKDFLLRFLASPSDSLRRELRFQFTQEVFSFHAVAPIPHDASQRGNLRGESSAHRISCRRSSRIKGEEDPEEPLFVLNPELLYVRISALGVRIHPQRKRIYRSPTHPGDITRWI